MGSELSWYSMKFRAGFKKAPRRWRDAAAVGIA
jgi:hypothetical protein